MQLAADSGLPVFGVNNVYQVSPVLDVLLSCNPEWWDYYWQQDKALRQADFAKWTWDWTTATRYGLNYMRGRWHEGFSTDPSFISYGHSSGYQVLNLAYHYGVRTFILAGYDMRYPAGYSSAKKLPGGDRHYFGEYPRQLKHWPRVGKDGEFTGLLREYEKLEAQNLDIEIINCSPGSALTMFGTGELAATLEKYG